MNVFIVEDRTIMLENLRSVLSGIPGITVVGYAADGADVLERADALTRCSPVL